MTLRELNALDPEAAARALGRCCGAARWVASMVASRPFGSEAALHAAADRQWRALGPDDWREAFAHHPRIGERAAAGWSRQEQSGALSAASAVSEALARGNREYERRFGFVFLVCAAGKTAEEILAALESRLGNDPETEIGIAAAEHARITHLRLDKLLREASEERP